MIELNLLPDVKLEYIKAQRTRRLVTTVAVLVSAGAVALLILLFAANTFQKKHISDLSKDIKAESSKLQSQPQIDKILTVQNQLGSLTDLHSKKPAASRIFSYLNEVTPSNVSISNFHIDFTTQTTTITGTADALSSINKYIDTLKYTTYSVGGQGSTKAFSNVVMSSFALSSSAKADQAATFTLNLAYDKNIFDISQSVDLTVPQVTTTRSSIDQPADLFQAAPATDKTKGGAQ